MEKRKAENGYVRSEKRRAGNEKEKLGTLVSMEPYFDVDLLAE